LAVREVECAVAWIGRAVGKNQLKPQTLIRRFPSSFRGEPFVPIEILALADGKIDLYRIHGGDGSHGTAAWIHQGTPLKLGLSRDAVYGRNQSCKVEIDLGGF